MSVKSITKEGFAGDVEVQLVTFELGAEIYGVDIMDVLEIHPWAEVRVIPHAPEYVLGIFNLRGEVIPIISLHTRFRLTPKVRQKDEDSMSGFVIFSIGETKIGILIDKILRVVSILQDQIVQTPQMISGAGIDYVHGVINYEGDGSKYLVMLELRSLFSTEELEKLRAYHRS